MRGVLVFPLVLAGEKLHATELHVCFSYAVELRSLDDTNDRRGLGGLKRIYRESASDNR
jgi:hypothetical protein